MAHRLLLPLPPAFSPPDSDVEEYSVFTYDDHNADVEHPTLKAYMDQLSAFLCKTRLIQYHPEDFFLIFLLHERKEATGEVEVLKHPDGSVVREEEVTYMRDLCGAFTTLMSDNNTLMVELHAMIRDGPPVGSAACLHSFFLETRALQMNRQRSPRNDAASVTLRTAQDNMPIASPSLASSLPQKGQEGDGLKKRHRRDRVMEAVLGHGMGRKKQHEVVVVRDTIVDLVECCNATQTDCGMLPPDPVETVLNVGEGKGYVSRALALCDGLQVVGLDCNPAHKERAMERVEFLLQGRLGVDVASGESRGRDMLNLMYEPRGHMATVACRVGPCMNWADVLRGHVRLSDGTSLEGCNIFADTIVPGQQEIEEVEAPRSLKGTNDGTKVQCRICCHITRKRAVNTIIRHVRRHLQSDDMNNFSGIPSKETIDGWNRELSVEAFNRKIITAFFTDEVCYKSNATVEDEASAKRTRVGYEGSCFSGGVVREKLRDTLNTYDRLMNVQLPRGTRAEVLLPMRQQKQQSILPLSHLGDGVNETGTPDNVLYQYVHTSLSIVGYDCAPNRHFVITDDGRQKEAFTLLQYHHGVNQMDGKLIDERYVPPAEEAWCMKIAVLLRVIPPVPPRMPIVHVPDLRNVVMMGLHPCGDLGSNVCRLFVESASRGLLLVSCCWHALTNAGFPLSYELQRRGWRTEQLSLLLATQPFDMWSTVSTEGHRESVCVLFYRSLLKLFWSRLRDRWQSLTDTSMAAVHCCPFAEVPHLEPAFLRRIAKIKSTITMEVFYVEVCREYFFDETTTARKPQYTWQPHVCSSCREAQTKYLLSDTNVALAAEIGREFFATHFAPFLGITVLRMWMCHLVETMLLLDRALFLSEMLRRDRRCRGSVVSLVPLFDGAVSPRMYGVLARRIPT
ncbi:hypothetical protein MOQ_007584 [Trypanosoma cruzi marinkellei]|uniref:Methyltransferase domain-containing protein n=1 Tax=Trypanosoma cruzi marinkellei TaxID=85056 RepID=K2N296_TRYCR|nr:hypothetical protein MOQ_007584 [Trypanosoma cruzi marinkellei]